MDSFLSELNEEGALDSEGVFTLDTSKAQLKLGKYQVQHFQAFVRFLVAAAVTSDTTNLRARVFKKTLTNPKPSTEFEFVGWTPTEKELATLGHQGLLKATQSLQHLAVALSTLTAKYSVRLHSQSTALLFLGNEIRIESAGRPQPYLRLQVGADLGDLIEARFRILTRWNSLDLTLDGRTFPNGLHTLRGWPSALGLYWIPDSKRLPVVLSPTHRECTVVDSERHTYPQILAFTKSNEANRFGFHIVVEGLPYSVGSDLDLPHICGVVVADHLELDISRSGIRKTEDYLAVLNQVRVSVTIMLEAILNLDVHLDSHQELCFHQLLSRLSKEFEVNHLAALLHNHLSRMQPCYEINEVASLKLRIPQTSRSEQETLFLGYQKMVTHLRLSGKMAEASWHLKAEIELRETVQHDSERQRLLLSLFELAQLGRSKDLVSGELTHEFAQQLGRWVKEGRVELSFSNREVIHTSWYLPLVLATTFDESRWDTAEKLTEAPLPTWALVLKALEKGEPENAMLHVRERGEMRYVENKIYWKRLLWAHFRGKLSWPTLISIRVRLTRGILEGGRSDVWTRLNRAFIGTSRTSSHGDFKAEAAKILRKDYFSKSFWPKFFHLWFYAEDWPKLRRALMAALLAQLLLDQLLASESADPLVQPVDWSSMGG